MILVISDLFYLVIILFMLRHRRLILILFSHHLFSQEIFLFDVLLSFNLNLVKVCWGMPVLQTILPDEFLFTTRRPLVTLQGRPSILGEVLILPTEKNYHVL
jgi:hypothetical protein